MTGRMQDKVAIITGSTMGIGKGCAIEFAKEGAIVIVSGRSEDLGKEVAAQIVADGGRAEFVRCDMLVDADCEHLVNYTKEKYGRIDVLVSNAGNIIAKPLVDITLDEWDHYVALDGRSYFLMMKLVLPIMDAQGGGSIINMTSLAAIRPEPGMSVYGFCKAGVNHMTKCVAKEYSAKQVRVNSVLPGVIMTPMIDGRPETPMMVASVPMGRAGTPEDVAKLCVYLGSDESSFVTGASYVIDGGVIS